MVRRSSRCRVGHCRPNRRCIFGLSTIDVLTIGPGNALSSVRMWRAVNTKGPRQGADGRRPAFEHGRPGGDGRDRTGQSTRDAPEGYVHWPDGRADVLPGMYGIAYNARVGDRAFGWAGDHVEPGVSIANPDEKADFALHYLTCIGNEATVTSRACQRRHGDRHRRARAHPGGLRARGAGGPDEWATPSRSVRWAGASALSELSAIEFKKTSPALARGFGLREENGQIICPVAMELPGAHHGIGRGTQRRIRRSGPDVRRPRADGGPGHRPDAAGRPRSPSATSTTASVDPIARDGGHLPVHPRRLGHDRPRPRHPDADDRPVRGPRRSRFPPAPNIASFSARACRGPKPRSPPTPPTWSPSPSPARSRIRPSGPAGRTVPARLRRHAPSCCRPRRASSTTSRWAIAPSAGRQTASTPASASARPTT